MGEKRRFTFKYRFNFKDRSGGSLQTNSLPEWPNEFDSIEEFVGAVREHAESFIRKVRDLG